MDALIQEIAKTFNIGNETVQNLINSYPQLRQQVAVYNVTTTVQAIMFVLGVISFMALVWSGGTAIINAYEYAKPSYGYGHRDGAGKQAIALLTKVAIASGVVFLTSLITFVVMTYLQATHATDVVVIKELLTQLK